MEYISILGILLNPRVVQSIQKTHSIFRTFDQQLSNEVLHLIRKVSRKLQIHTQNLSVGLLPAASGLERSMAGAELIAQHSYTPNIHHLIVISPHNYLWRDIVQGTAKSISLRTTLLKNYLLLT